MGSMYPQLQRMLLSWRCQSSFEPPDLTAAPAPPNHPNPNPGLPSALCRTHSCPPAALNDSIFRQPSPSFLSLYLFGARPRSPQIRDGSLGARRNDSWHILSPNPLLNCLPLRSGHLPVWVAATRPQSGEDWKLARSPARFSRHFLESRAHRLSSLSHRPASLTLAMDLKEHTGLCCGALPLPHTPHRSLLSHPPSRGVKETKIFLHQRFTESTLAVWAMRGGLMHKIYFAAALCSSGLSGVFFFFQTNNL